MRKDEKVSEKLKKDQGKNWKIGHKMLDVRCLILQNKTSLLLIFFINRLHSIRFYKHHCKILTSLIFIFSQKMSLDSFDAYFIGHVIVLVPYFFFMIFVIKIAKKNFFFEKLNLLP